MVAGRGAEGPRGKAGAALLAAGVFELADAAGAEVEGAGADGDDGAETAGVGIAVGGATGTFGLAESNA